MDQRKTVLSGIGCWRNNSAGSGFTSSSAVCGRRALQVRLSLAPKALKGVDARSVMKLVRPASVVNVSEDIGQEARLSCVTRRSVATSVVLGVVSTGCASSVGAKGRFASSAGPGWHCNCIRQRLGDQ